MHRWLLLTLVACGGAAKTAPPSNQAPGTPVAKEPTRANPWIDKLYDLTTRERALTELEALGDPAAIEAIGKVFLEDHAPRTLQVLIAIARPLTPEEAKAKFFVDYETTGRPDNGKRALPFLIRAMNEIDPANPRSVDAATKAADAIGEARLVDGAEALIGLAHRPMAKRIYTPQISAIRALGKLTAAAGTIGPALAKLVDLEPPKHPRLATSKEEDRQLEESYGLHLARTGAAINALAELRVTSETKSLVMAMYRTPELATQVRRALVIGGSSDILLEVLAGKHAAVEQLIKARKLDRYCGDQDELPCQPTAMREFYAAVVLGDLRDPRATPALIAALKQPAAPAYYYAEEAGPTQHSAIFDALRKLGSPEAAGPLLAIWTDRKVDVAVRASAMEAYGFVSRDALGTRELMKIAADNAADENLRISAASTLARLSTDKADIAVMLGLARKYLEASATKRKDAVRLQPTADAADRTFDQAKQTFDKAKQALLDITKDANASADDIRKKTQAVKQAEDVFKAAKKKHREAIAPFKQANDAAKAYVGYARIFQTHVARIGVAIRCGNTTECFAATLMLNPDAAAKDVEPYIKDVATWTADEKVGLVEAEIERAMLELGKRGVAASAHTDALLDHAVSDDRIIRQSILLALPKIANRPCASCVAKLDKAIAAGEGKTTLGELTLETTILRNYFAR